MLHIIASWIEVALQERNLWSFLLVMLLFSFVLASLSSERPTHYIKTFFIFLLWGIEIDFILQTVRLPAAVFYLDSQCDVLVAKIPTAPLKPIATYLVFLPSVWEQNWESISSLSVSHRRAGGSGPEGGTEEGAWGTPAPPGWVLRSSDGPHKAGTCAL